MGNAWILQPVLPRSGHGASHDLRLGETARLAEALGLRVRGAESVRVRKPRAATLFGSGFVDRKRDAFQSAEADPVIVDGFLSPVQQRNLERGWGCKVLDRTALILEIFARRARSREGRVQVEHARLSYEKSRLVRSWTHLERQRGGFGFMGGPGETQIEADRRALDGRLAKLDAELKRIAGNRKTQRNARQRTGMPSVALVGYTNAGKSTLFNRICDAETVAQDMLFATLDTSIRRRRLPRGAQVAFSDTVGFISDLPAELVAAFRATLLEVTEADIVLHVIDASSEEWADQRNCVLDTLAQIGVRESDGARILEVHNKADLLEPEQREAVSARLERTGRGAVVSAETGENLAGLLERIEEALARDACRYRIRFAPHAGKALAWLHSKGAIDERRAAGAGEGSADDSASLEVAARLSPAEAKRFEHRFRDEIREILPLA